jgi:hypothetical protein
LAPASLGSALGMMRAKSIGALQFGQDGASNWSSVGWLMVVLPPLYMARANADFACDISQSRSFSHGRKVIGRL